MEDGGCCWGQEILCKFEIQIIFGTALTEIILLSTKNDGTYNSNNHIYVLLYFHKILTKTFSKQIRLSKLLRKITSELHLKVAKFGWGEREGFHFKIVLFLLLRMYKCWWLWWLNVDYDDKWTDRQTLVIVELLWQLKKKNCKVLMELFCKILIPVCI